MIPHKRFLYHNFVPVSLVVVLHPCLFHCMSLSSCQFCCIFIFVRSFILLFSLFLVNFSIFCDAALLFLTSFLHNSSVVFCHFYLQFCVVFFSAMFLVFFICAPFQCLTYFFSNLFLVQPSRYSIVSVLFPFSFSIVLHLVVFSGKSLDLSALFLFFLSYCL